MKVLIALAALVASVTSASALTTKYTSELEPFSSPHETATLTEEEIGLALSYISSDRADHEKRAFIRRLVK